MQEDAGGAAHDDTGYPKVEAIEGSIRILVGIVRNTFFDAADGNNPEDLDKLFKTKRFEYTMHNRELKMLNKIAPHIHPVYTAQNTLGSFEMAFDSRDPTLLRVTFKITPKPGILMGRAAGKEAGPCGIVGYVFTISRERYTEEADWIAAMISIVEEAGLETVGI